MVNQKDLFVREFLHHKLQCLLRAQKTFQYLFRRHEYVPFQFFFAQLLQFVVIKLDVVLFHLDMTPGDLIFVA